MLQKGHPHLETVIISFSALAIALAAPLIAALLAGVGANLVAAGIALATGNLFLCNQFISNALGLLVMIGGIAAGPAGAHVAYSILAGIMGANFVGALLGGRICK